MPIVFLVVIIVIGVAQANAKRVNEGSQKQRRNEKLQELKPAARTCIGKYLVGLPMSVNRLLSLIALVVGDQFLFLDGIGREHDKIPRDAINQIVVDDKSQITQTLIQYRELLIAIFVGFQKFPNLITI